jgi:hypothetical protein
MNQIWVRYCCCQIFILCYAFEGSVSYLHVMFLSCILVTTQFPLNLLLNQPPYESHLKFP